MGDRRGDVQFFHPCESAGSSERTEPLIALHRGIALHDGTRHSRIPHRDLCGLAVSSPRKSSCRTPPHPGRGRPPLDTGVVSWGTGRGRPLPAKACGPTRCIDPGILPLDCPQRSVRVISIAVASVSPWRGGREYPGGPIPGPEHSPSRDYNPTISPIVAVSPFSDDGRRDA